MESMQIESLCIQESLPVLYWANIQEGHKPSFLFFLHSFGMDEVCTSQGVMASSGTHSLRINSSPTIGVKFQSERSILMCFNCTVYQE